MDMIPRPVDLQIVDRTLAVKWDDGREDYYDSELLRVISPSAANIGEADFFGNVRGGDPRSSYPGARVIRWERIGDYAIRLFFNDGHSSGYFTYKYLRLIADKDRLGFEFPFQKDAHACSHDHDDGGDD
jgi:DUF971 family protein